MKIETLRFEKARFAYEEEQIVFQSLEVEVPTNACLFVSGPNGSGQSTFLKLLAVLVQPQSGHYFINGIDTTNMSFEEFLPYRRKIGYTFDYGGLFSNRTLLDNLALPLVYHKISTEEEAEAEIIALAEKFKFVNQLNQRPAAVSGGLRKLVCVLRSFLTKPEMIVMDDPFTGIGPEGSTKLVELINSKHEAGELRHIFLTSREETWAKRLGAKTLWIDSERLELLEAEKAA
jgi:phospholipid/cholesterol/gamma-HCH transport system ATP-binding protein